MSGAFKRIINPGYAEGDIYCAVKFDGRRLSITGVDGPMDNGDARGGCGQITDTVRACTPRAPWDAAAIARFCDVWDAYHLNDMHAGCIHQRHMGWRPCQGHATHDVTDMCPEPLIRPVAPPPRYHSSRITCQYDAVNAPCPVCGYKYGTAWIFEAVPHDVLAYLEALPETTRQPAWV